MALDALKATAMTAGKSHLENPVVKTDCGKRK
jgi:hypothetical protein